VSNKVNTLRDFIEWAELEEEREYDYFSCSCCLLTQYLSDRGVYITGVGHSVYSNGTEMIDLGEHLNEVSEETPHTVKAALSRAKALV